MSPPLYILVVDPFVLLVKTSMAPIKLAPISLLACLYCLGVFVSSVWGEKARHFEWEVEYMYGAPDCLENVVMGINGQFPGPTIKARAGDTVVVHLTNKLHTEGVVIHWHGIRQVKTVHIFIYKLSYKLLRL